MKRSAYIYLSLHDRYIDRLNGVYQKIIEEARNLQAEGKLTRFFLDKQYVPQDEHLTLGFLSPKGDCRERLESLFKEMVEKEKFESYCLQNSSEQQEVDDIKSIAMECFLVDTSAIGFSCKLAVLHHHYLNYCGYYGDNAPKVESIKQEIKALRATREDSLPTNIPTLYAREIILHGVAVMQAQSM